MAGRDGTVKDALIAALRRAADHNPLVEVAPCAVLWPDPSRLWEALVPVVRSELRVVTHGGYDRDSDTGPAVWILYALSEARVTGDGGCPPIVYLPGIELHCLRDVVHCPHQLQPLAGLQYRAIAWVQPDGREWTAPAFFRSRECGLGLELKSGVQTEEALIAALPRLLDIPVAELEEQSPLRARDFEALGAKPDAEEAALRALIAGGETDTVEFKETGRYNMIAVPGTGGKGQPPEMKPGSDPRLEREIWKAVGGFLNSSTGGTLLLGVRDDKSIRGMEDDYSVTKSGRKGQDPRDVWQLFVVNLLAEHFGKWVVSCITVSIRELEGKDVCRIDVRAAPRPAWAKEGKPDDDLNEVFYLRSSGSTHRLPPSQATEYSRNRWPG